MTDKKRKREVEEYQKLFALYEVFFVRVTKKLRERDDYDDVSGPFFLCHLLLRDLIKEADGQYHTTATDKPTVGPTTTVEDNDAVSESGSGGQPTVL